MKFIRIKLIIFKKQTEIFHHFIYNLEVLFVLFCYLPVGAAQVLPFQKTSQFLIFQIPLFVQILNPNKKESDCKYMKKKIEILYLPQMQVLIT